jgi:hypothetical protein
MRRPVRIVAIQQVTEPVKDGELPSTIKAVIRVLDAQFHERVSLVVEAVLNRDMNSAEFSVMSSQYNISTVGACER